MSLNNLSLVTCHLLVLSEVEGSLCDRREHYA